MFGLHMPELAILLVVALVIFGPKRLPEIGGALGKGIKEFRKGTEGVEDKLTGSDSVQVPPPSQADVRVPEKPVETVSHESQVR